MKLYFYLLFCCICPFLIACSGQKNDTGNIPVAETILKYSEAKHLNINFSSLFDYVQVIPLDTTGNFLLNGIKQMRVCQDHFFITDESNQIFVFDQEGKGRTVISRIGQSGEEYINLRGSDISTTDSLICMLVYPPKLMYFTFDGKLVHQEKLNSRGFAIDISRDVVTIFNDNTIEAKNKLLTIKNRVNGKEEKYISGQTFLEGRTMPAVEQRRYFTKLPDGKALFFHPLSNLIYSLDNGNISIKYQLDFGDRNPIDDLIRQPKAGDDIFDFIDEYFPVWGFNSCWENDLYFYIRVRINKEIKDLFYDKKEGQFYAGNLQDDMIDCSVKFTEATNQYLAGYVSADDVLGLMDYMKSENMDISLKSERKQLFDFAENAGNPVVLLYHFKEK